MIHATIHKGAKTVTLKTKSHTIYADKPVKDGGNGMGMNPNVLLQGAIASCMSINAQRTCAAYGLEPDAIEITVSLDFETTDKVTFYRHVKLNCDCPEETKQAILKEVGNCFVCQLVNSEKTFVDTIE